MELREKITKAIERAMLEDTGKGVGVQCRAAGYILAIPELQEALGLSPISLGWGQGQEEPLSPPSEDDLN